MRALTIADTAIRQDEAGRYCLNDLHRAAGGAPNDRPTFFLRRKETADLLAELGACADSHTPVNTVNDGVFNGTFVARELVYAYAMWISPVFHLKVIRAYDTLVATPSPKLPTNMIEALRLAADALERATVSEAALAVAAPKVEAHDRLQNADGTMNITMAAKALQMPPQQLFKRMREKGWIYPGRNGRSYLAYQARLVSGQLVHKVNTIPTDDGDRVVSRVLVTAKGLTALAKAISAEKGQVAG